MKNILFYISLIFLSLLTSCVDNITPDYEFEEQVFISGILTSEADYVTVQIQNTVQVTDSIFSSVNNAQVSLFTRDVSNTVSLVSDSFVANNGEYTTSGIVTPIIGNTYWVEVMLEDETLLKSEEELLKSSIPILRMEKNEDVVQIIYADPTETQMFYFAQVEVFRENELIDEYIYLINDTQLSEDLEASLSVGNINEGDTVKVNFHHINFNTFQFYYNVFNVGDGINVASLFLPRSIVGNITNMTTNELALGNFSIAGFSTMTIDF